MTKVAFFMMLALAAILPPTAANAANGGCGGPLYDRLAQAAYQGYQRAVADHAQKMKQVLDAGGSSSGQGGGSILGNCLSKYKNFNIAGSLGLPSVNLSSIEKQAEQGACNMIDSTYDQLAGPERLNAILPGSGASADLGLPSSSDIGQGVNVYGQEPGVIQQGINRAEQSIR